MTAKTYIYAETRHPVSGALAAERVDIVCECGAAYSVEPFEGGWSSDKDFCRECGEVLVDEPLSRYFAGWTKGVPE